MGQITFEERRGVFLTQQKARDQVLARLSAPPTKISAAANAPRDRARLILETVMIAALLGGSWLVYHTVAFHLPASAVETLLPRL